MSPTSSTIRARRPRATTVSDVNQQVAAYMATEKGSAAVNKTDAAKLVGVSVDHFDEHISADLPVVLSGRRRIYLVRDLLLWLEDSAMRARDEVVS